jgi:hypothetical protein
MSHFYVIAIVPDTENVDIKEFIEDKMGRYCESREVEPYDEECGCVGSQAYSDAWKAADKKFGTMDDLRKRFVPIREKILTGLGVDPSMGMYDEGWTREIEKAVNVAWKEHRKEHEDYEAEVKANHPMNGKPDPKCDECHGTGVYQSTYNPDSQWDWYRIGGRWDGAITHTEDNSEDNGFNFGVHHESKSKNAITASRFLDNFTPKDVPYAILDPDGEWHQRGKMGWWGLSSDESDTWDTDAHEILKKYRDGYVFVGLDCHI